MSGRGRVLLAGLLLVAAVLRLTFVFSLPAPRLFWDEVHYNQQASVYGWALRGLAGLTTTAPTLGEAFVNSLQKGEAYTAGVGVIFAVFRFDPIPVFIIQALLDTLTCFFIWGVANHLGGLVTGVVALAFAAVYEPFIFACARLQTETFAGCLLMGGLWTLVGSSTRERAFAFLGGMLIGTSMLVKPALQFLLPLLVVLLLIRAPGPERRRQLGIVLALLMGFFVLIGPRLLLTKMLTGQAEWTGSLDPAAHVYGGTVPENGGWKTDRQSFAYPPTGELLAVLGPSPTRTPTIADFWSATWRTWIYHPLDSGRVILHKLYEAAQHPYNDSRFTFLLGTTPLRWQHEAILLLALIGIPLALRHWRRSAVLVAVSFYLWATYLLISIEVRYVITVMPLMICFAAYALDILRTAVRKTWAQADRATPVATGVVLGLACVLIERSSPGRLLALIPGLGVTAAETLHEGLIVGVIVLSAALLVRLLRSIWLGPGLVLAIGSALATLLLVVLIGRPVAASGRSWRLPLAPGSGIARLDITLPNDLPLPKEARLKLDLLPAATPGCDLVVRINGVERQRYAGAPRRENSDLPSEAFYGRVTAAQRREDEPLHGWYSIPISLEETSPGTTLQIEVEAQGGTSGADCVVLFGDYPTPDGRYDGPSPFSPARVADTSLYKYLIEGDFRMRRQVDVNGVAHSTLHDGRERQTSDLSPAAGRQFGRFRIFLVLEYDTMAKIF